MQNLLQPYIGLMHAQRSVYYYLGHRTDFPWKTELHLIGEFVDSGYTPDFRSRAQLPFFLSPFSDDTIWSYVLVFKVHLFMPVLPVGEHS